MAERRDTSSIEFSGFSPKKVTAVRPWLPAALTAIRKHTGRRVPSRTVYAMTDAEIKRDRKIREPGNENGAGHGRWEPDGTVKVNPHLSAYLILLNTVHELIHAQDPEMSEPDVDEMTDRILKEIGADLREATWDQQAPYGVSKQRRWTPGFVPLPLGRKRRKGEVINPALYQEDDANLYDRITRTPGPELLTPGKKADDESSYHSFTSAPPETPYGTPNSAYRDYPRPPSLFGAHKTPDPKVTARRSGDSYKNNYTQGDGDRNPVKTQQEGHYDRAALGEQIERGVETLYVFDMDDTLIFHPSKEAGKRRWKELTGEPWPHKRWWSVAKTLQPPFEFAAVSSTKAAFNKAKQDPAGKVVVMTGRVASPAMKQTIPKLLWSLGFGSLRFGDNLFLKRPNAPDTAAWKIAMLHGFAKRFPDLQRIEMWEDRPDHAKRFQREIDRIDGIKGTVHVVRATPPAHIAASRETLYDRVIAEQFPNAPWWRQQHEPFEPYQKEPRQGKKADAGSRRDAQSEEPERPLENPLPGNISRRALHRAAGSRMQRAREPRPPR